MLYLVIERFKDCDARAVYERFESHGRLLPDGLTRLQSWVELNYDRCFQLMECDRPELLQQWVLEWQDLVTFEIVPVTESAVAAAVAKLR